MENNADKSNAYPSDKAVRDESRKGGLSQEESGGPGSREKRANQEKDGQLEQGRKNDLND